jgi:hypothetical protein
MLRYCVLLCSSATGTLNGTYVAYYIAKTMHTLLIWRNLVVQNTALPFFYHVFALILLGPTNVLVLTAFYEEPTIYW